MNCYFQPGGRLERQWDRFIETSTWQQVRVRRRRLISALRKQRLLVSADISIDLYTRASRLAFLIVVEDYIIKAARRAVRQHWGTQRFFWSVFAE